VPNVTFEAPWDSVKLPISQPTRMSHWCMVHQICHACRKTMCSWPILFTLALSKDYFEEKLDCYQMIKKLWRIFPLIKQGFIKEKWDEQK